MKLRILIFLQFLITALTFGQNGNYYIPFKQGDLWSIADKNGRILFEPGLQETFPSTFDLIRFRQGGKFGFIRPNGNVIIEPIYDKATDYFYFGGKTQSYVSLGETAFYIDLKGEKIIPLYGCGGTFSNMPNGLKVFEENGKYGLVSLKKDTIAKPVFINIINYDDGEFVIAQNTEMKFGLIDYKGDTLYPFTLDSVVYDYENIVNKFYRIYNGKLSGIVDIRGHVIAQPIYEILEFYPQFRGGLCFKAIKGDYVLGYVYEGKEYWSQ